MAFGQATGADGQLSKTVPTASCRIGRGQPAARAPICVELAGYSATLICLHKIPRASAHPRGLVTTGRCAYFSGSVLGS
ncbi:hypothetical protein ACVMB1_002755 [Bradyrhizobium sp. USDA 4504]